MSEAGEITPSAFAEQLDETKAVARDDALRASLSTNQGMEIHPMGCYISS